MLKIIGAAHDRLMKERYQEYIHHKRAAEMWRDEGKRRFGAEEDEDDSRIRRWWDRRGERRYTMTPYQGALMANNMAYRDRHYWEINRGRG